MFLSISFQKIPGVKREIEREREGGAREGGRQRGREAEGERERERQRASTAAHRRLCFPARYVFGCR